MTNTIIDDKTTHRPSGSMCINCKHLAYQHCNDLSFTKMKPIKTDKDGVIVVKCTHYERAN